MTSRTHTCLASTQPFATGRFLTVAGEPAWHDDYGATSEATDKSGENAVGGVEEHLRELARQVAAPRQASRAVRGDPR